MNMVAELPIREHEPIRLDVTVAPVDWPHEVLVESKDGRVQMDLEYFYPPAAEHAVTMDLGAQVSLQFSGDNLRLMRICIESSADLDKVPEAVDALSIPDKYAKLRRSETNFAFGTSLAKRLVAFIQDHGTELDESHEDDDESDFYHEHASGV